MLPQGFCCRSGGAFDEKVGVLTFPPPIFLFPLADTENKQCSKDHQEDASCAGPHDDIEMQLFLCKKRRWLRERILGRVALSLPRPASNIIQMKESCGTFHLTGLGFPGWASQAGVLYESARAEEHGLPPHPSPTGKSILALRGRMTY